MYLSTTRFFNNTWNNILETKFVHLTYFNKINKINSVVKIQLKLLTDQGSNHKIIVKIIVIFEYKITIGCDMMIALQTNKQK